MQIMPGHVNHLNKKMIRGAAIHGQPLSSLLEKIPYWGRRWVLEEASTVLRCFKRIVGRVSHCAASEKTFEQCPQTYFYDEEASRHLTLADLFMRDKL